MEIGNSVEFSSAQYPREHVQISGMDLLIPSFEELLSLFPVQQNAI